MTLSHTGVQLIIWQAVFTVLTIKAVAFRFWAAKIKGRRLRPDDYLVTLAFIGTLMLQACTCWATANGLGAHTKDVKENESMIQYRVLLANGITWLFATVLCKVAILYFYTTVFRTRQFATTARSLMAINILYGVSLFITLLSGCMPINYKWNPTTPGGPCKDITIGEVVSASLNLALDVAIVVLPLPCLWTWQVSPRKKASIGGLFVLGAIVIAVMAWRVWLQAQPANKKDYVYVAGVYDLLNLLELWLGIIIACLPTLIPLFTKYIKPEGSGDSRDSKQPKEVDRTTGNWGRHRFRRFNADTLGGKSALDIEKAKFPSYSSHASSQSGYPTSPAYPVAPAPVVPTGPESRLLTGKSLPATPKLAHEAMMECNRAIKVRSDVTVYSEPSKW